MTKPKRYQRYSPEFKREAIRRAAEEGTTDKTVCDELEIISAIRMANAENSGRNLAAKLCPHHYDWSCAQFCQPLPQKSR